MSVVLQADDFTASGALSSSTYTAVLDAFTQDGQRVYPSGLAQVETVAVLSAFDPSGILSASTPKIIRYEVDVRTPSTLPASGDVRLGLVGFARSNNRDGLAFLLERMTGGATNRVNLLILRPTGVTTAALSLYSTTVTIAAATTYRLRMDVTVNAGNLVVVCYFDNAQVFTSTPSVTLFNQITTRSLSAFTSSTMYAAIYGDNNHVVSAPPVGPPFPPPAAGPPTEATRGYLDRLRVFDVGSLADQPALNPEPTLTTAATLATLAVTAEDDSGAETLTLQPSYAVELRDRWQVTQHVYDGGNTATVAAQTVQRRAWRFHWDALSSSQKTTLETLRDAVYGPKKAFAWTDPETGGAIKVRFESQVTITQLAPAVWSAEADVGEVLAGG